MITAYRYHYSQHSPKFGSNKLSMRDNLDIARSYRRLSDVCDEWLTPIVRLASTTHLKTHNPSDLSVNQYGSSMEDAAAALYKLKTVQ